MRTAQRGDPAEFDTRYGTVHLTIGGGGHPYRTPARRLHGPHEGIVITGVEPGDPLVQRRSVIETEPAVWSAYSDTKAAFGFASFDVAPVEAGGTTSITVTYWAASDGSPSYRARDRVVLRKPLRASQRPDDQLAGTRQARRSLGLSRPASCSPICAQPGTRMYAAWQPTNVQVAASVRRWPDQARQWRS